LEICKMFWYIRNSDFELIAQDTKVTCFNTISFYSNNNLQYMDENDN